MINLVFGCLDDIMNIVSIQIPTVFEEQLLENPMGLLTTTMCHSV